MRKLQRRPISASDMHEVRCAEVENGKGQMVCLRREWTTTLLKNSYSAEYAPSSPL